MSRKRTINATYLTDKDKLIIKLAEKISKCLSESITDDQKRNKFISDYGKIDYSRDAGMGLGGGKLQRDALCTRGKTDHSPVSNRNLRWNPLVVSKNAIPFATRIDSIRECDGSLFFRVLDEEGYPTEYAAEQVYNLEKRYVITSEQWEPIKDVLRNYTDVEWTQNSCVIGADEACEWYNAIESYAVLGLGVAVALFGADFDSTYEKVCEILGEQTIDPHINLPTEDFPKDKIDIIDCPMMRISIDNNLDKYRKNPRPEVWKPNWVNSKRNEGDDSSLQIMHIKPLVEYEIRHLPTNVRYGFRWCNVAMSDHTMEETFDFFHDVLENNGRI